MPDVDPRFIKKAESAFTDADWKKSISLLDETAQTGPGSCHAVISIFRRLSAPDKKGPCFFNYTLGHLSNEILAHYCFIGAIDWGEALSAKAATKDTEALQEFHRAYRHRLSQQDIDQALRAAALRRERQENKPAGLISYSTDFHYETGNHAENVLFLLKMNANSSGTNSDLLLAAVEQNNLGIVLHLMQNCDLLREMGPLALQRAADRKRDIIHYFLQERLRQSEEFHRAGAEILVENRTLDLHGGQLKIVFNFATRRVTEIFENSRDKTAAINSTSFADYDMDVLKNAHDKLKSIGGEPRPLPPRHKNGLSRIDKP